MASQPEALKGALDIHLTPTRAAARPTSKGVATFGRAFRAWLQTTQFGPDRSRESGRHLGARC